MLMTSHSAPTCPWVMRNTVCTRKEGWKWYSRTGYRLTSSSTSAWLKSSPTGGRSSWATGNIPILASSAVKIGVPCMKIVDVAHASEEVGPECAVCGRRLRFVADKHRLLVLHPMPFAFEVALPHPPHACTSADAHPLIQMTSTVGSLSMICRPSSFASVDFPLASREPAKNQNEYTNIC
jgi:hypothetical protein